MHIWWKRLLLFPYELKYSFSLPLNVTTLRVQFISTIYYKLRYRSNFDYMVTMIIDRLMQLPHYVQRLWFVLGRLRNILCSHLSILKPSPEVKIKLAKKLELSAKFKKSVGDRTWSQSPKLPMQLLSLVEKKPK